MLLKITVHAARFFVGAMFVFSGFVKLVDPIGSQYKFEEYFSPDVLDIAFLIPYALPFSVVLILAEIILGVLLLVGLKPKLVLQSILALTTLFLFLTWYSAFYDKVTDCGCFGDAIKLSPWETFYKNIVLIAFIAFLLKQQQHIKAFGSVKFAKIVAVLLSISFGGVLYFVLTHLPIIDFRPYAVGKNISEGMVYQNDGKIPKVHDFSLESATEDLTATLLQEEKVLLVLLYDLEKAPVASFLPIKEITEKAMQKGYTVYGVSASFEGDLILAQNQYDLPFEFLFCDGTTLKTMIRATPGIMTLSKGTVTGKWHWSDAYKITL